MRFLLATACSWVLGPILRANMCFCLHKWSGFGSSKGACVTLASCVFSDRLDLTNWLVVGMSELLLLYEMSSLAPKMFIMSRWSPFVAWDWFGITLFWPSRNPFHTVHWKKNLPRGFQDPKMYVAEMSAFWTKNVKPMTDCCVLGV